MAPSANAQKTRCQRAGWLPAGKLWVALEAIVYAAESYVVVAKIMAIMEKTESEDQR